MITFQPDDMAPMTDERRSAILTWLTDHGVDPMDVYQLDIGESHMDVHRYLRGRDGKLETVIDEQGGRHPKGRIDRVPLKRAMP